MSGSKKKSRLKRLTGWSLKFLFKLLMVVIILSILQVFVLRFFNPPFTVAMLYDWITCKINSRPYANPDYQWRPLKKISPLLIRAVLAGEDQRFMEHHGFDFIEMNQALKDILLSGRIRGASTITMQVSRSVFLWPGRNLFRKTAEAYYTVLTELLLTKMRILEIYLNVVDWGPGVMGAEAAAQKYFHRSSEEINAIQAAGMAAILPSPHKWSPVEPSDIVMERRKRIMRDMPKMHL